MAISPQRSVEHARRSKRSRQGGSAAIEFALIAPVFVFLVVGILETSLYFFKRHCVRYAVFEVARDLQTGEIQKSANVADAFSASVCTNTPDYLECDDVQFDVRSFASLSDVTFPDPNFTDEGVATNFVFQPGYQEQITTVRAATRHNFITPMMKQIFQADGFPVVLVGYSVSKNEPFGCIDEC